MTPAAEITTAPALVAPAPFERWADRVSFLSGLLTVPEECAVWYADGMCPVEAADHIIVNTGRGR